MDYVFQNAWMGIPKKWGRGTLPYEHTCNETCMQVSRIRNAMMVQSSVKNDFGILKKMGKV